MGPHPDANLLTAFAEQSLPEAERRVVLDHLARCTGCREVVALALPTTEDSVVAVRENTGARWFGSSLLRWGFAVACLALLAAAGVLEYQQRHREITVASNNVPNLQDTAPAATTPSGMQPAPSQSVQAPAPPAIRDKERATDREQNPSRYIAAPTEQRVLPNSNAAAAPAVSGRAISAIGGGKYTANAPLKAAGAAIAGSGSGGGIGPRSAGGAAAEVTVQAETASAEDSTPEVVGKAKPAPAEGIVFGLARAPDLHAEPGLMKKASVGLRWTISASGALQRSSDGGSTWQDVDVSTTQLSGSQKLISAKSSTVVAVTGGPEASENADSGAATKPATQASVAEETKSTPTPAATAIFRAVSVSSDGAEVWAGGSAGALYHTSDAGATWTRVLPSENGAAISGDVVSIQFSDVRNGSITTSTAETWVTRDGGQNWRKQ